MKVTDVKPFVVDCYRTNWVFVKIYTDAPVIIGLKQNPTQMGAALVLFSLFTGIFENFR